MKSVSSLFLVLLFSLGLSSVYADPAKMGVVDLQRIMQTSTQMKAIQQKLEKEFQPRRNKLVAMEQNLKKDMEKFKREAAVMSMPQKKVNNISRN